MATKKIDSLQILRTLACIGVFLFHSKITVSGHWAISIFIMLSGFLMYYRYSERTVDSSIGKSFSFAVKKIFKLYPLHIVTMLMIMVIKYHSIVNTIEHISNGIMVFGGQVLSNVLLVQSWIPNSDYCYSLNLVSWYLSTALFLYFIFPKLLAFFKKRITTVKKAIFSIVIVILVEIVLSYAAFYIDMHFMGGDGEFTRWFTYVFPILRVIDLFIGMNVAYIFMNMKSPKKTTVTIFEIVAVIAIIFTEYIHNITQHTVNADWFKYNLIYIIPVILLLYSFATNKGIIEKILNNKIVLFIADMSGYIFLIQIITIWFTRLLIPKITHNYFDYIIQGVCAFILTIIASFIWSKIENTVKEKVSNIKK